MTGRAGRYWLMDNTDNSSPYNSHDRNPSWTYDADGRLISMHESSPDDSLPYVAAQHTYDAAGQHVTMTQTTSRRVGIHSILQKTALIQTDMYDGVGLAVRQDRTKQVNGGTPFTVTTYYLRSRVLGGRVITEYNSQGARQNSYAYAGGDVLARQFGIDTAAPQLLWRHENPVTGDLRETTEAGLLADETHLDPGGVDAGASDPQPDGESGGSTGSEVDSSQAWIDRVLAGLIAGYARGPRCRVDGMLAGCRFAGNVLRSEGGGIGPQHSTIFVRYMGRTVPASFHIYNV